MRQICQQTFKVHRKAKLIVRIDRPHHLKGSLQGDHSSDVSPLSKNQQRILLSSNVGDQFSGKNPYLKS